MRQAPVDPGVLQQLLEDKLAKEEEQAALEKLIQVPHMALPLLSALHQQKHRYKAALEESRKAAQGLEGCLRDLREQLERSPWYPATVIQLLTEPTPRALVASGGRRMAVQIDSSVDASLLRPGASVFLNTGMNVILALADGIQGRGCVGEFSRFSGEVALLRAAGDEEIAIDVADEVMAGGLKAGDLVLYDREALVATARLEKKDGAAYHLGEPPDVAFDDIGGLDPIIEEIRDEVTLHAFHPDVARSHRLRPRKGIILSGPPGCGKTMLAKALANYLAHLNGTRATFLNIKPGIHRSSWYGQTEAKVRELFAVARAAADAEDRFALMFFDDFEALGARGGDAATAIDSRVLPSFLAEMDGLVDLPRVWVVGATNRPDLLDEALLRPGRFGDRVFRIPRPDRRAVEAIFRKHLRPDVPYYGVNGEGADQAITVMVHAALAALYAPNGLDFTLAVLVFRDGSRRPLTAPDVISGAFIAQGAAEAKRRSCLRVLRGHPAGVTTRDLLAGLEQQLRGILQRLKPGPALRQMLDLPEDLDVVKVEVDPRWQLPGSHEYWHSP
jgi:proteasome-associated ATPase